MQADPLPEKRESWADRFLQLILVVIGLILFAIVLALTYGTFGRLSG